MRIGFRAYLLNALRGGGWLLLPVAALLALAAGLPKLPVTRDAYDHLVIFDVSQSMNVEDYFLGGKPVSRLSFAKHAVAEALRNPRCDTRIGWGVFATKPIPRGTITWALDALDQRFTDEQIAALNVSEGWFIPAQVLKHRVRAGVLELLIRWVGYDQEDDSWESAANVEHVQLVSEYLQEHGIDASSGRVSRRSRR